MQMPTSSQINSALRHVYTAAGTLVAVLLFFGINPDLAHSIEPAVQKIGEGFASIMAGISMLIPVASGLYAAWTASPFAKMIALKKDGVTALQATKGTPAGIAAEEVPSDKFVAK